MYVHFFYCPSTPQFPPPPVSDCRIHPTGPPLTPTSIHAETNPARFDGGGGCDGLYTALNHSPSSSISSALNNEV
jgi:hypothetical protein